MTAVSRSPPTSLPGTRSATQQTSGEGQAPVVVVSCFSYRTSKDCAWTDADHSIKKFVDALKGRPVRGYGHLLVNGMPPKRQIDQETAAQAFDWFGEMAVRILVERGVTSALLVPVPDAGSTLSVTLCRAAALARAVQHEGGDGFSVADVLRWDRARASASAGGGTRSAAELFGALRLREGCGMEAGRCVLIDDVLTTGGHLRACAAFLKLHGVLAELAICGVKSDAEPVADPFMERVSVLEDFAPPGRSVAEEA
ncbi:MAG: hypothetical protein ABL993_15370 [Vicinamibacterales bacterium]